MITNRQATKPGRNPGRLGLPVLIVAGLGLLIGCKSVHADLCERASDCGGGGDDEVEACMVDLNSREQIADIYGCEDLWDNYIECLDDNSTCNDEELAGCETRHEQQKKCVDTARDGKAKIELKKVE